MKCGVSWSIIVDHVFHQANNSCVFRVTAFYEGIFVKPL